jgi:hypothetical protein
VDSFKARYGFQIISQRLVGLREKFIKPAGVKPIGGYSEVHSSSPLEIGEPDTTRFGIVEKVDG